MSTKPFSEILECIYSLKEGKNDSIRSKLRRLDYNISSEQWKLEMYLKEMNSEWDQITYCMGIIDEMYELYWEYEKKESNISSDDSFDDFFNPEYQLYSKCSFILKKAMHSIVFLMGSKLHIFFSNEVIEKYQNLYDEKQRCCLEVLYPLNVAEEMRQSNENREYIRKTIGERKDIKQDSLRFEGATKYGEEKLKRIFELLLENQYIAKDTDLCDFYYWMGLTQDVAGEKIKPINWISTLKSLHVWINTFYLHDPKKWKKTVACFLRNGKKIKINSLVNANKKNDNTSSIEEIFKLWKSGN